MQILRVGRIVSVDLGGATCVVEAGDPDDETVETTEIQWGAIRAGKTIVWSPPSIGEQVLLFCPGGDIAQAIPLGALFCNEFPAPGDDLREFVRFGDEAEIGYDPEEHHFDITLPADATAHIEATGGVSIKGDVSIEGALTVSEDIRGDSDLSIGGTGEIAGDLTADGISVANHTHPGVQGGGSSTGTPQ